jgi:hypothetical protein
MGLRAERRRKRGKITPAESLSPHAYAVDAHQENKNHLRKLDINQGCEPAPKLTLPRWSFAA